jgi:hypothetical protein
MNENKRLLMIYFGRFINRIDVYNQQWATSTDYGYKTIYAPVTLKLIAKHLKGELTLAFFALSKDGTCKWCCWDSDKEDGRLDRLQAVLSAHGWRVIREGRRPGRDGHLWLFFDKPVPAAILRQFGALFQKTAGIVDDELEFFPKQEKAKVGSSVRGPLGVHKKPGAQNVRGLFEDAPTVDLVSQLKWFAVQPVNKAADLLMFTDELQVRLLLSKQGLKRRFANNKTMATTKLFASNKILQLVTGLRKVGNSFVAACPVCVAEGHDKHKDNLHISLDGKLFSCWYSGQPGKYHPAREIIQALKKNWR